MIGIRMSKLSYNPFHVIALVVVLIPLLCSKVNAQTPEMPVGPSGSTSPSPGTTGRLNTAGVVNQPVDRGLYILGPGDRITVHVFGADDIPDRPIEVGSDGKINLPMVGMVQASGVTVRDLEVDLVRRYSTYFKEPQVNVTVTDYRSQPVTVAGSVNLPNVVQLHGPTRLMEVISQAGGLRPDAGNTVTVAHQNSPNKNSDNDPATSSPDSNANFNIKQIDLQKIIDGSDPSANIVVEANDLVTVSKAKMIYVVGDVGRPGAFVLDGHSGSIAVLQAIALAGGINRTAASSKARILRATNEDDMHRVESQIDLNKILSNKSPDIALHADDILYVPNSKAKNASLRALEMAVNVGTGIAIWHF
jgi:polysaccharide biosynthesis/export protein